jgi:alpha-galactosidase
VCPNHQCGRVTPFNARADIAHLGATGYELDTTKLSQDELAEIKMQVAKYKEMEELVLNGDLYRLNNPLEENLFAEMLVSKDKAKASITVMRPLCRPNGECIRVYPKGLDEKALYYVKEMDLTKTGGTLMNVGLIVGFPSGDFQTRTFTLKKV